MSDTTTIPEATEEINMDDLPKKNRPKVTIIDEDGEVIKDITDHAGPEAKKATKIEEPEVEEVTDEELQDELKDFISGKILLFIMDLIIPNLTAWMFKLLSKIYTIDKKKMRLDEDEKETLEKPADAVAKIIFGRLTVVQQFLVATIVIYAMKAEDAIIKKEENES